MSRALFDRRKENIFHPQALANAYRQLKNELDTIEAIRADILSQFFLQPSPKKKRAADEEESDSGLYLKSTEHREFAKFCDERYFPSYDRIMLLTQKVEELLRAPVNYPSKKEFSQKYKKLRGKIFPNEEGHAKILYHYNKELTFAPHNSFVNAFTNLVIISPIRTGISLLTATTGSKVNAYAILFFSVYSVWNYTVNGLFKTGVHTATFTGAYILYDMLRQKIRPHLL